MRISDWSSDVCSSDLFKLSNDPQFVEKLRDVVGLYVDPPAHAIVLSLDEKSQIQALDRTQPGLPLKKGRAGTMTHDYKRHGKTTDRKSSVQGTRVTARVDLGGVGIIKKKI